MKTYRRSVALVATVAFLAGGASSAVAYWANTGTGNGNADAGHVQPVTLSAGVPGAPLYPGADVSVEVTVTNPNEGAAEIRSIVLDTDQGTGGFTVDPAHATCGVAALGFTAQNNGGLGWELPPRDGSTDGTLDISLPAALSMSADAANECQGASFTVYLAAGA